MGEHYYEKADALTRRERVRQRSSFYQAHPGGAYFDIDEANQET
jgi:hypothetical protein